MRCRQSRAGWQPHRKDGGWRPTMAAQHPTTLCRAPLYSSFPCSNSQSTTLPLLLKPVHGRRLTAAPIGTWRGLTTSTSIRSQPPRLVNARQGGKRRVMCSAFAKAPWPPTFERPLHHPSNLKQNVYDFTYPSEEAAQRGMFTDLIAWASARWTIPDAMSDPREYRRITRAQARAVDEH